VRLRVVIAGGLLVALIGYRVGVLVYALHAQATGVDVARFFEIAHSSGRPYVDYMVEYPPLLVAVVKGIALVAPSRTPFGVTIVLLSMVAEAAIAVLMWRAWGLRAALIFLFIDSFLLALFVVRLDLLSTALVVGALVALLSRRGVIAGLLIVAAVGLKLWPAPLALVMVPIAPPFVRRRYVRALLGSAVVLALVWVGVGGGGDAIRQVVTFRNSTGWQIESAMGSVVHLFTHERVITEAGANRFGHVPGGLVPALYILAALLTVWVISAVRPRTIASAWVATVGAFLVCSTLLSPQFIAWLVPAAAIAWIARDRAVTVAVFVAVIFTMLEDLNYNALVRLEPAAEALVIVRNVALLAAVALAVRSVRANRGAAPSVQQRPASTV
jgi:hypothetical protein